MFLCLLHLTRLFNDQLIKVTLIKGIVQPLSCYLQSGTPKMSKHWLQEKQNMTVFVFQIVHSYCLYGNMTLKRNIYISGKGCPIARPFYGYGSKSINIDSIGYTMANISWSSLVSTSLWNISYFRGTSWFCHPISRVVLLHCDILSQPLLRIHIFIPSFSGFFSLKLFTLFSFQFLNP